MLRRDCSRCGGDGWVNIPHPVRPGVIMQRLPCRRCNPQGTRPSPSDGVWTYAIGVDPGTSSSTGTVTVLAVNDSTCTITATYETGPVPSKEPVEADTRPQGRFPRPPLVLTPPGGLARPYRPLVRLQRRVGPGGIGTKNWHRRARA